MNTIIEKIRAEIKIRLSANGAFDEEGDSAWHYDQGLNDAYNYILSFLSDLEKEERPINPEDAMKELDEKIALVKQRGTWDGVDVDKYMDEVRGREPEKPMNQEGLEEEINRLWESFADEMEGPHNLFDIYARLARHFAQWGAEHRGSSEIPKDLEEAAGEYERIEGHSYYPSIKDAFIAGASWQKERDEKELSEKIASAYQLGLADKEKQMMKEAVTKEGKFERPSRDASGLGYLEISTLNTPFEEGDEVIIQIRKK